MFQVVEVAADAQVLPLRVRGDGAGAPEAVPAALEEAEAVDALRVEDVLLRLVQEDLEPDRAADHLVRGRFHDAALRIVAGIDAGDVAAGGEVRLAAPVRVQRV